MVLFNKILLLILECINVKLNLNSVNYFKFISLPEGNVEFF